MFDWYGNLGIVGKILVGAVALVVIFVVVFLLTTLFLSRGGEDSEAQRQQASVSPEVSRQMEEIPDASITVESANWQGENVVVEGIIAEGVSSVSCDLFGGGDAYSELLTWWDRDTAAEVSGQSFTQTFTVAEGEQIPSDTEGTQAYCAAVFADATFGTSGAPVEGSPGS